MEIYQAVCLFECNTCTCSIAYSEFQVVLRNMGIVIINDIHCRIGLVICFDFPDRPLVMGCYGIGTTRLLAAVIEVLSTNDEIRWPKLIAPHQICIIPQKVHIHHRGPSLFYNVYNAVIHGYFV